MTVPYFYYSLTPIKTVVKYGMATPNFIREPIIIDFVSRIRPRITGCFQGSHQNYFLLRAQCFAQHIFLGHLLTLGWVAMVRYSPDYETECYWRKFPNLYLNFFPEISMSFPRTLLVFIPEPTCQLCPPVKSTNIMVDERVQNGTLVPGLLYRRTNYHSLYCSLVQSTLNTRMDTTVGWLVYS